MNARERKAMDEARRDILEEERPTGVSYDDAQTLFEDGWKAALEWAKGKK